MWASIPGFATIENGKAKIVMCAESSLVQESTSSLSALPVQRRASSQMLYRFVRNVPGMAGLVLVFI